MQHESNLLLPCPFCGSTGAVIKEESNFYGFCGDCDTEGPWSPMRDRAVTAWNTRATAAPVVVGDQIKIVESDAIPPGLVVLTQNGKPIATIRCCTCHDERQKALCLNKHECVQVTAALAGD